MNTAVPNHTIKSEVRETISLGLPLITSYVIYSSSNFIGTAMVARLGQDALAASILVSIIWASLSVLFFGILNAVSILVSHQHGAKNHKAISEIMQQAFLLDVIMTALLILIMSCVPFMLRWSSQSEAVLHLALQYMHALLWTVPGLLTLIIAEGFLAGIGRAKVIMRISMIVVPIEIPLIYIFIFGKLGLPACGVAGVGYGFAVTYTVAAICLILFLKKSKQYKQYQIFANFKFENFHYLKELIRVGLPIGFMNFIEVSTFAFSTFWIARFGTTMLAAHQIVMQYLGFIITLVFSMSTAVTIRVGHAVGRLDLTGVKYAAFVGMFVNFVLVFIIAIALIAVPTLFIRVDVNIYSKINSELVSDASMLLGIIAVLLLIENFRIIGSGALRGLKDTRFTMYASFISFWLVGLPAAYLFAFNFNLQARGIWWGLTFGIAIGALIHILRLNYLVKHVDLKEVLNKSLNNP